MEESRASPSSPPPASLEVGGTQFFSATAKNASGSIVAGVNIQYVVSVPVGFNYSSPVTIAGNGNACAGTWNATISVCTPGTPGIALVTAVVNGVSSAPATVDVHNHISSIQIVNAEDQPPLYDCFTQGQTWMYKAIAYSGTQDITDSVGPLSWSSNPANVVTATPVVLQQPPYQVFNQAQLTAAVPGVTQVFATVSGTSSAPLNYTTCLIQAIYLQIGGQGQAGNYISVSNGGSVPVTATAIDSIYPFTGVALPHPPLTWSTTNPEVAQFTTATNTTGTNNGSARNNIGGATLTASCSPPSCNIGVFPSIPVYASNGTLPNKTQGYSAISVNVTESQTLPTYTAWAATSQCNNVPGCTSALFPVTPGTTPIGTILTLPRTPNSLVFNHQSSSRLYIGSDQGLMYVDVSGSGQSTVVPVSSSEIPCSVALCGTVLTISNDGHFVVVSDAISTPNQVHIFNGSASLDLLIPGETATAASFSPDGSKLFILTAQGNMYVYSTVDAFASVQLAAPASDVSFAADGSFAYLAGTPANAVSAYSTCPVGGAPTVEIGSVATSVAPVKIFPSPQLPPFLQSGTGPTTQNLVALEVPSANSNQSTSVQKLSAQFTQTAQANEAVPPCSNPPVQLNLSAGQPYSLGQGNFTPIYSRLVANGTELILVAQNIPAVLVFDVNNGTTTSIPLHQLSAPPIIFSASASTDGSQVYVAACDQYPIPYTDGSCTLGSVHIINTCGAQSCNAPPNLGQGDFQQVPYINVNDQNNPNMCNGLGLNAPLCTPNLIAIKPQ